MSGAERVAPRLARAVGDAAVGLGIRDEASEVADAALALLAEPVELYDSHAVWPCLLTRAGVPVELSLKLDGDGPALRCVVDVTDHRFGGEENWSRYLGAAASATAAAGDTEQEVWDLCRRHLDGVPPAFRSRMMHGIGFAGGGRRRGSLYFRTGWLSPEDGAQRLPEEWELVARATQRYGGSHGSTVEVLGYDFVEGSPPRRKAYVWPALHASTTFAQAVGLHPDLEPGQALFDAFREQARPERHPHPLMLQVSDTGGTGHQRLFFFSAAWGWDTAPGVEELRRVLQRELGVDLDPLAVVGEAADRHGFALALAMVAIGADGGGPSVSFYLWPEPPAGDAAPRGVTPLGTQDPAPWREARGCLKRGIAYLTGSRRADGSWSDYDAADTGLVTAYVGWELAGTGIELAPTARRLLEWLEDADPEPGALDLEVSALALAAVRAGGLEPGDAARRLLHPVDGEEEEFFAVAERTSAVLEALLVAAPERIGLILPAVTSVVAAQEDDGGWPSWRWTDRGVATGRSVRALRAFGESAVAATPAGAATRLAAERAIKRAAVHLAAAPVRRTPFAVGSWLGGWAASGQDPRAPAVGRALAALRDSQRPDGRWLGGPSRRVPPGAGEHGGGAPARVDGACVVTTATVVAGLHAMLEASP